VLVCFSDSQLSVNLITGSVSKFHTYAVLIQDIKDLLASRNFRIFHTLREGNQCADFLAKLGASSNASYSVHQSPPLDLISLLRSDAMGTVFLRT
jgi:ribonuclease HI